MRKRTRSFLAVGLTVPVLVALTLTLASASTPEAPNGIPVVGRYEIFEIPLDLTGFEYDNPFDPREIDVMGYFNEPDTEDIPGEVKAVPGFWDGEGWYVRFTPVRVGRYTYYVTAQDADDPAPVTIKEGAFVSRAAPHNKGFLRNSQDNVYYMEYDDGTPFFGVGLNRAWYPGDPQGINEGDWVPFAKEAEYGINYHRIWTTMWYNEDLDEPAWGAIENISQPGAGWYDMDAAAKLEAVLDEANEADVYIQLVLYIHTNFTYNDPNSVTIGGKPCVYPGACDYNDIAHAKNPDMSDWTLYWFPNWSANPYNAANGGPLTRRTYFFTDPEARRLAKQKFRYFIARWGGYTNIAAWEFWNELQYGFWADFWCGWNPLPVPPGYPTDAREWQRMWHQEMAQFFDDSDPYGHLLTTSDPTFSCYHWEAEPWLDNVNYHTYDQKDPKLVAAEIRNRNLGLRSFNKPIIPGEFGTSNDADWPEHAHNGMWASAMTGSATTAMDWNDGDKPHPQVEDWDELCMTAECMPDGQDHGPSILPEVKVLAGFLTDANFASSNYAPTTSSVDLPGQLALAMLDKPTPKDEYDTPKDRGMVWIQNQGSGVVSGATLTIDGFADAYYTVTWIDDYTGAVIASSRDNLATGGQLAVAVPDYEKSIAAKIYWHHDVE